MIVADDIWYLHASTCQTMVLLESRLVTDKVPDCVNALAVFISRQCANKLSVLLQPTSYKLQHLNHHEEKTRCQPPYIPALYL